MILQINNHHTGEKRTLCLLVLTLLLPVLGLWSCTPSGNNNAQPSPSPSAETAKTQEASSLRLWQTVTETQKLTVIQGDEQEAKDYYTALQQKLVNFTPSPLTESTIGDMLVYYGFPGLLPTDLQKLSSAVIMDFGQLRNAVSNQTDFNAAYTAKPLHAGEILVSRFFAPKIINVGDPQSGGVPKDGFGWRKVLNPILDSALIIFGVLLLVLGISVLSRPVEAALCRSTPNCNGWEVTNYGCQFGGCSCNRCCYYELGRCNEYPDASAYFQRCNLGDCHLP